MIEFKNISISFNGKNILTDFSLFIKKGDKVVITGKSGLGKSTILKLLLGLILPDSGEVLFNGKRIDKKIVWEFRKQAVYVNQSSDIGEGIVTEQINRYLNFKSNRHHHTLDLSNYLKYFLLPEDILNKMIEELSGGERQRIAIIISLLLDRKIFLLDEITASLDKELKELTAAYFMNNPEWTVIAISHDEQWKNNPNVKLIEPEWGNGR